MNQWGIPTEVESHLRHRDKQCVYCGIAFNSCGTRKSKPSWEHIINDVNIATNENIALCCISCNASKGAKLLSQWLDSPYCKSKSIRTDTVAAVIKEALQSTPINSDQT